MQLGGYYKLNSTRNLGGVPGGSLNSDQGLRLPSGSRRTLSEASASISSSAVLVFIN